MFKNKKRALLLAFVFATISANLIVNVSGTTPKVEKRGNIVFSQFENFNSNIMTKTFSLDDMLMVSVDDPYFIITKDSVATATKSGLELEVVENSFNNGQLSYSLYSNEPLSEADVNITSPVMYVEQPVDEIYIPFEAVQADNPVSLKLEVVDSIARFPHADSHVMINFEATDVNFVPYDLTLVNNGQVYTEKSVSYYFDNETGEFTHGYVVFLDVEMDDLCADAHLTCDSALYKYNALEAKIALD